MGHTTTRMAQDVYRVTSDAEIASAQNDGFQPVAEAAEGQLKAQGQGH